MYLAEDLFVECEALCTIISDIINSRTLFHLQYKQSGQRKTLEDDQQTPPESVSSSSRRRGGAKHYEDDHTTTTMMVSNEFIYKRDRLNFCQNLCQKIPREEYYCHSVFFAPLNPIFHYKMYICPTSDPRFTLHCQLYSLQLNCPLSLHQSTLCCYSILFTSKCTHNYYSS